MVKLYFITRFFTISQHISKIVEAFILRQIISQCIFSIFGGNTLWHFCVWRRWWYSNADGFSLTTETGDDFTITEEVIGFVAENFTKFNIDYIDVQSCYSYRDYDEDGWTVATELLRSDKIKTVFACNGSLVFINEYVLNLCSTPFCSIYRLERDNTQTVVPHNCGFITTLVFWGGWLWKKFCYILCC